MGSVTNGDNDKEDRKTRRVRLYLITVLFVSVDRAHRSPERCRRLVSALAIRFYYVGIRAVSSVVLRTFLDVVKRVSLSFFFFYPDVDWFRLSENEGGASWIVRWFDSGG